MHAAPDLVERVEARLEVVVLADPRILDVRDRLVARRAQAESQERQTVVETEVSGVGAVPRGVQPREQAGVRRQRPGGRGSRLEIHRSLAPQRRDDLCRVAPVAVAGEVVGARRVGDDEQDVRPLAAPAAGQKKRASNEKTSGDADVSDSRGTGE
jgi:hypothetical protein